MRASIKDNEPFSVASRLNGRSSKVPSGSRSMSYALQSGRPSLRFLTMSSQSVRAALLIADFTISTTTITGSATLGTASTACTLSHELRNEARDGRFPDLRH